jgi:2-oxoglutarate ferredoxin oxidoreductase subunit alpha
MTATSGSGFALMIEGIGLAELRKLRRIVLGRKTGPAVGLPTRTEQGELLFAIRSGTGVPQGSPSSGDGGRRFPSGDKA